jgi:general secretion pathway protein L
MSTLIVQIPPRPRLSARGADAAPMRAPSEYAFVLSADGRSAGSHGRSTPDLMPKARELLLLVDEADVSWRRIDIPKAPPARLRAALAGMLEEMLLEDDSDIHFALAPQARPGGNGWVAAVSRPWLSLHIAAFEQAGMYVDRVAPAMVPERNLAHASAVIDPFSAEPTDSLRVCISDERGVLCLPLAAAAALGPLSANAIAATGDNVAAIPLRWSASPAAAAAAEKVAGAAVPVVTDAQNMVAAAQEPWNLRQFELAPRQRGTRALRAGWSTFLGPDWSPVRLGLIAVVAVHLIGLNVWAWQQRRAISREREAVAQVLRDTFPQVRAIQNAPIQMAKEVDVLRAAAGRPGDADLEPLLYAAEGAWPSTRGPVETLKFEPGRLTLSANGWTPQEIERFRTQLRGGGIQVEATAGRLTLSRSPSAAVAGGQS